MIKFQPFPILETTHLRLIELSYEHINDLYLMRNDNSMHEFTDTKPDDSIEETRIYIQKMIKGAVDNKWIIWAIEHKGTKKIIGTICIWNIMNNSAELGYGITPDYQAQGLMQETLIRIVEYGLTNLGFYYLDAYTEVSNIRSIKLLEKCGFKYYKKTIDIGHLHNRDYHMMCYRIQRDYI